MRAKADGQEIERCLLELAAARGPDKTFCPSEIARRLEATHWRSLMPDIREVAGQLVRAGKLRCSQHGAAADPQTAHGPIRLGLPPPA